jgi:hypothetical protein
LRDRPCDRSLIGDTNNESELAREICHEGFVLPAALWSTPAALPTTVT